MPHAPSRRYSRDIREIEQHRERVAAESAGPGQHQMVNDLAECRFHLPEVFLAQSGDAAGQLGHLGGCQILAPALPLVPGAGWMTSRITRPKLACLSRLG